METRLCFTPRLPSRNGVSTRLSGKPVHVVNVALVELWGKYRRALQNGLPSVFCSLEKITYSSSGKYECVFETDPVVKEVIEVKCKLANVIFMSSLLW